MEADLISQANELSEKLKDAGVSAVRNLVPEPRETLTEDDLECEVCGQDLPERRALLGYTVCVFCSEFQEKQSKRTRIRSYDE